MSLTSGEAHLKVMPTHGVAKETLLEAAASGSDGTRTRRRDRPGLPFQGWPGRARDLPREQGPPTVALR